MTLQEIIYNTGPKKKLQAGGTAPGTIGENQDDLAKKTIRDPAMVEQAQGLAGGAPVAPGKPGIPGLPTAGTKTEPLHVIIDKGGGGIGGGGGLTGMVNNLAGNVVSKGFGAIGSIFKNRNQPQQPAVPTAATGGLLVKKKVPKAALGSDIYNPAAMGLPQMPGLQPIGQQAKATITMPGSEAPGQSPGAKGGRLNAGSIAAGGAQIADLAGDALLAMKPIGPMSTWGVEAQTKKGNRMEVAGAALKGAGKGAAAGASIGSFLGPVGTGIGAAAGALFGGISGLLKAKKKVKTDAIDIKNSNDLAYSDYNQKANANIFKGLSTPSYTQQRTAMGKEGAKIAIKKKLDGSKKNAISWHGRTFKLKCGGRLAALGEVNIIPDGTLHKENNNLGQKDKGIPIIDGEGKKVFEVEKEELILRLKTTQEVEGLVEKYKKSHNDRHLIDLGKLLSTEIMTNTHDFSGRYGLEVK
jgi:hypothetical protein